MEKDDLRACASFQVAATVGKAPWRRSRLMVIGEGNVGKTATVRSLLFKEFDPEWKSTIGVTTTETKISDKASWKETEKTHFLSSLVNTIAAERPLKLGNQQAGKARGKSVKVIPSPKPIPKTPKQPKPPETQAATRTPAVSTVEESKTSASRSGTHLMNPVVAKAKAPKLQRRYSKPKEHIYRFDKSLFTDKAAGASVNVSVWDYGGQTVFHTLHHLLLSKYGVYLLVFSLPELLSRPTIAYQYIDFWINSVALHAEKAPVVIAGTFADAAQSKEELVNVDLAIKALLPKDNAIARAENLTYFPIDNKSQRGVDALRGKIESVCTAQEHVNFEVASAWMRCLDSLMETSRPWLRLAEVKQVGIDHGVNSAEELDTMLKLFHEFGVILYFTSTENLRDIVTLDPQWLVDQISKVIRDNEIHRAKYPLQEIDRAGLTEDLEVMFRQGLASRDILEFFWSEDQRGFLIDLMRRLLLLSRWHFVSKEEIYLVPSLLKASSKRTSLKGTTCELRFRFLPNGVFERLICLAVEYSSQIYAQGNAQPELFHDLCTLHLEEDNTVTFMRGNKIITVEVEREVHASQTLQVLLAMMKKLREDIMGSRFSWQVFVSSPNTMVSLADAKKQSLAPWFSTEMKEDRRSNTASISRFLSTF